jgi:hypothetical protein
LARDVEAGPRLDTGTEAGFYSENLESCGELEASKAEK